MNGLKGVFVGLATVDLIHRVAHPVGVNEKMTALDQEIVAGGPAANAAVTFALLGGEAVLATDLGTHPLARLAHDDLARYGFGCALRDRLRLGSRGVHEPGHRCHR